MAHYHEDIYDLSHEKAAALIPVIVIISILMVIGLVGNPLVVYFYGFRMKPTASYMFIVMLAICDMISCAISMPLEIYDMVHFYSFENIGACKTFRFVNYASSIASGALLIAIAVDRFRKICKPFDAQISNNLAKWIIAICVGFSFLVSWPSAVFYSVVNVNITENPATIGFDCTTIRDNDYKIFITIYNMFLFFLFLATMIVLIVLYCLVGRQLFQLRNFRFYATKRKDSEFATSGVVSHTSVTLSEEKKSSISEDRKSSDIDVCKSQPVGVVNDCFNESSSSPHSPTSIQFDLSNLNANTTEDDLEESKKQNDVNSNEYGSTGKAQQTETNHAEHSRGSTVSNDSSKELAPNMHRKKSSTGSMKLQQQNINTRKYTIITISITVAFIVSFLPHLSLVTWRTLSKDYEVNVLSGAGLILFQLFIRSNLFSSACNPVIYGFLNTEFKNMIVDYLKKVCCCCKRNSKNTESSTFSVGSS